MKFKTVFIVLLSFIVLFSCKEDKEVVANRIFVENSTLHYIELKYYLSFPDTVVKEFPIESYSRTQLFTLYSLKSGMYNPYDNPSSYDSVSIFVDFALRGTIVNNVDLLDVNSFSIVSDSLQIKNDVSYNYMLFTIDDDFLNSFNK